jgi:hypothetical protein
MSERDGHENIAWAGTLLAVEERWLRPTDRIDQRNGNEARNPFCLYQPKEEPMTKIALTTALAAAVLMPAPLLVRVNMTSS